MPFKINGRTRKSLADFGTGAITPTSHVVKIVPNDDEDLPEGACRTVVCETKGLLHALMEDGAEVAGYPLFAGYNPVAVKRVFEDTTAQNLWAIY